MTHQLVFTQIHSPRLELTFEIVGNGTLAVKACAEMRPRMILMDVSMPEMNGLEATGCIRESETEQGARTPIVGVTAHALKGDRGALHRGRHGRFIYPKPISPKLLLEMIEKWIGGDAEADRLKA